MPQNRADVLDCSKPSNFLFWFVVGTGFAMILMASQGVSNWASLLRVGSSNPALRHMEDELGPIVSPDETGHDAQLYYLVARDPFAKGDTVNVLMSFDTNPPRYRYRRILYPLLAGGLGNFSGRTTLFGMAFLAALGLGLVSVASADLAFQLGLPGGAAFLSLVNLGAFLSAMMLTPDIFAFGLSYLGIALLKRHQTWAAIGMFALAATTKEVYLLVPFAMSAWRWRERLPWLRIAVLPVLPIALWTACVSVIVPAIPATVPLFSIPLSGLIGSVPEWLDRNKDNAVELILAAYVVASFLAASFFAFTARVAMLRFLILPWLAIAVCSTSIAVWDIPSNVARQFPVFWSLSMLALVDWFAGRSDQSPSV